MHKSWNLIEGRKNELQRQAGVKPGYEDRYLEVADGLKLYSRDYPGAADRRRCCAFTA